MGMHHAVRALLAMVLLAMVLLAMVLGATVIGILPGSPPASAAPRDGTPFDSAVTASGKGGFAGLHVTVSQTKSLINQAITVSWTGGIPTLPAGDQFGVNYLQIMQCWGDDPAGPDRTQCQYGGASTQSAPEAGNFVRSRQLNYAAGLVDPKETLTQPAGNVFVPFWPVGSARPTSSATSDRNDFFDSQVTNEIPLAPTRGDGTGLEFFEVQTVRQAAGLGCGDPVPTGAGTKGRSCWLVVVPRGTVEVDGSTRNGTGTSRLDSSPLSHANWDNRIVVPLEFLPVGQACPIGAPERRVIGHELATDAVSSWQPALCADGGALYSYSQLADDIIRDQVLDGGTPGLALLTNPIPPDQAPPQGPLLYAPVALSGLAITFNIEHQPSGLASPADLQRAGQRFTSMKLTPRLMAKLLTQSYRGAVVGPPDYLKNSPDGLTVDPEFLDLNPEYQGFAGGNKPPDALVQLGSSDVTSLLWSWVNTDPEARAFLAGAPDPFGMVVNPNNKGLTLPTSTYPRNDQTCIDRNLGNSVTGRACTLDSRPFTNDMHEAGRSAGLGDTQARTPVVGPDNQTPTLRKLDRQVPGQRALLAVVDAATATRYGLPTAALHNAAGHFVTPTTASLLAGAAAMKPSAVAGVLASDPGAADPAAYPLTALSYAATAPSQLDAAAGKDYAAFLRYAAGAGQQPGSAPGQLPFGMAPLPDALKAQTTAAAATIEAQAGKTATATTTVLDVTPALPAAAGTTATLTAMVTPSAAGSVQFTDGTANIGGAVAISGGTATFTTTLPSGTHSLTAVFTPTDPAAFSGSTSNTVFSVVNAPTTGAKATTTTLKMFRNPAYQGIPVILNAIVTPPTAAGTVQLKDGATVLGAPMPVRGGRALLITRTQAQGTHSLTAVFTPANPAAFGPSTSSPVLLTVAPLLSRRDR